MDATPIGSPALLSRLAADSDPQSWAVLIERHGAAMYRAAHAVAGHRDAADDAVQEALLHVRLRAGRFRAPDGEGDAAVGRWLARLAANAALHLQRGERRRRRREAAVARSAATGTGASGDDRGAAPWGEALAQALADLPSTDRHLILLRYSEGLDHRAIAAALACREDAARKRLHRAHQRLRAHLQRAGVVTTLALLGARLDAAAASWAAVAVPAELAAAWTSLIWSPRQGTLPFHHLTGDPSSMTITSLSAAAALVVIGAVAATLITAADGGLPPPGLPPDAPRGDATNPPSPAAVIDDPTARRTAADAGAGFACDMYARLAKPVGGEAPGNLFFSPHSLHAALSMTMAGARGETLAEMRAVLRHTLPDADAQRGMALLGKALIPSDDARGQPTFMLTSANRLWRQQGYPFRQDYIALLGATYGAGIEAMDFAKQPEASRQTINAWVERKTNDRIKDLIPTGGIGRDTRLVLTNAVHFKAGWDFSGGFGKASTKPAPFFAPGQPIEVPMMHRILRTAHHAIGGSDLVALGFRGDQVEMILLVPRDVDAMAAQGLHALETALTPTAVQGWRDAAQVKPVDLSLPRFAMGWKRSDMHTVLAEAGMRTAITPTAADFTRIHDAGEPFWIGAVIHQSFLAVDEEGAEAAAATAVVMRGSGIIKNPPPPIVVRCDRPFLTLIRHIPTGAWLFLGRVVRPGMVAGEDARRSPVPAPFSTTTSRRGVVRSAPDGGAGVSTILDAGTPVEVVAVTASGEWCRIRNPQRVSCWMREEDLIPVDGGARWRVAATGAKARDDANLGGRVVAELQPGALVDVRESSVGAWRPVHVPSAPAYILADDLVIPAERAAEIPREP